MLGAMNLKPCLYKPIAACLPRFKGPHSHPKLSKVLRAETKEATDLFGGTNSPEEIVDECGYNVGDYCSIDEDGKRVTTRTLGEMEQEFLEAMQAWYYDGKSIMSDDEFENLKDELIWQGSEVALLTTAEQKFLEASLAYSKGKVLLTDEEYDALKRELKQQDSFVTLAGPRCSLRTRKMYSDLRVDYLKMTLLNVPAVTLVLALLFSIDDISGFEVTNLIELPEPWGALVLWGVVLPACFVLSQQLTNFVLREGLILKGVCPNCGAEVSMYFGDIFTVAGNKDTGETVCGSCNSKLLFSNLLREITVIPQEQS